MRILLVVTVICIVILVVVLANHDVGNLNNDNRIQSRLLGLHSIDDVLARVYPKYQYHKSLNMKKYLSTPDKYTYMTYDEEYNGTAISLFIDKFIESSTITLINNIDPLDQPLKNDLIIIYINLDKCTDRNNYMISEFKNKGFYDKYPIYRLSAYKRKQGALGCYLSHLACLAFAIKMNMNKNVNILICEDDLEFYIDEVSFSKQIVDTYKLLNGRLDVIMVGQYVLDWQPIESDDMTNSVYKILSAKTTSGYIVYSNYLIRLFTFWLKHIHSICINNGMDTADNIDQLQTLLQPSDMWIAYKDPMGGQRQGYSNIVNMVTDNKWRHDLLHYTSPFIIKPKTRIAMCHIATGKYLQYIDNIHRDIYHKFLKGYNISLFLFTDDTILTNNKSACTMSKSKEGLPLYIYIMFQEKVSLKILYIDIITC